MPNWYHGYSLWVFDMYNTCGIPVHMRENIEYWVACNSYGSLFSDKTFLKYKLFLNDHNGILM